MLAATLQVTSVICLISEWPIPGGPADKGRSLSLSQQPNCMQSSSVSVGQGWAGATQAAIQNTNALETALPVSKLWGGPHSPPWKSWGKQSCLESGCSHRTAVGAQSFRYPPHTHTRLALLMAQKYIKTTVLDVFAMRSSLITLQRNFCKGNFYRKWFKCLFRKPHMGSLRCALF